MKTKTIFTLLIAFFSLVYLQAQDGDEEMKMLFKKKDKSGSGNQKMANGGYGSFSVGYTKIDGKDAIVIGGRAAWVANHRFSLGLAGRGFFNDMNSSKEYNPNYSPNQDPNYSLAGGYGGIFFEPIVAWNAPVHVSFPILIGAGGVTASPSDWSSYDNYYSNNYYYNVDAFFVFEPGVDVEFNITKFFKIAVGGSYRLTNNISLYYEYYKDPADQYPEVVQIPSNALRNFNVDISFKFGWF